MHNENIKVSDLIALFLKEKKINLVFGIIGSANSHIFDSIKRLNYTKIICMHHEQSLTMAMQTYYRVTKKIGVALVTAGGASANAITGVISAWADSIPGIIISGQENLKYVRKYKKNNLRMWGIQGFDSVKRLTKPENILFELNYCLHESLDSRPGPVWLDIPIDIQGAKVKKKLKTLNLKNKKQKTNSNIENKIKKLILNSKRPVFWFGNGIKISNSKKLIPKLLDDLQFPFFLSWAAVDLINSDHKLNYGRPGVYGNRASNIILQNSDLIISIGARLSITMMGYVEKEFARNSKIIYVDIDKTEYSKFDNKKKFLFYKNDAKNFINFLSKEFRKSKKKIINKDWLNYCKKTLNNFPHLEQSTHDDTKGYINSYKFIHKLSSILKKKTCIVTDMGTALLSGHQKITLKKNQMIMTSTGLGEMGYGLPGAIGASFGLNKGEVICLNCDGGIMMNLQELQTIDEYNLPIKTFIFNNDGYLMIKHTQKNLFKGNYVAVNKKTNISCPNLKKLASTFNMKYYLIKNWDDFESKTKKILSSKKPIICEVLMNPEQYFHPKLGTAINKEGRIISPPLEDLSPLLSRTDLKKNMIIPIHKKSKEI